MEVLEGGEISFVLLRLFIRLTFSLMCTCVIFGKDVDVRSDAGGGCLISA